VSFRINILIILCLLYSLSSCSPRSTGCLATEQQSAIEIYIVQHGWHSGIVLPTAKIHEKSGILAQLADGYQFIEIGWGDQEFYLRDGGGFWIGLRAAVLPTSSVLHVVGIDRSPEYYFPVSRVHSLYYNREAFIELLEFIESSFIVEGSEPVWVAPPLYGKGGFYASGSKFHLFNNCNTWVADALGYSGCALSFIQSLTSRGLSSQLEQLEQLERLGREESVDRNTVEGLK